MDFWEHAINSAISEELKNQNFEGNYETNDDAKQHEKNLVFCQLVSFGHIMLSFKLPLNITKELVNKYAKKYLFSEEETENIMFAVNESLESTKDG